MADQAEVAQATLFHVKILHSSATDTYSCDEGMEVKVGDLVVVPTRYGLELGRIKGAVQAGAKVQQKISRKATQEDCERCQSHRSSEQNAFRICKEKIAEHDLDMKLVNAHYCIDEKKILFYFTAENRVDFRQLVKDLVSIFKTRIELRQIGVRDEARVLGGMGVCGRTYCCHGITDKLKAVSIKMAKEQSLTLNSLKISGPCGRLLCCLAYEYETYKELKKSLPSEGTRIRAGGRNFKLLDINIFRRQARLEAEDGSSRLLSFDDIYHDSNLGQWRIREK
jgi:cell fate regulator YaaT (PSP1 superfamily)